MNAEPHCIYLIDVELSSRTVTVRHIRELFASRDVQVVRSIEIAKDYWLFDCQVEPDRMCHTARQLLTIAGVRSVERLVSKGTLTPEP